MLTVRCSCGGAVRKCGKPHKSRPIAKYVEWSDMVGRRSLLRRSGIQKNRRKMRKDIESARATLERFPSLKRRIIKRELESFNEPFDLSYLHRSYKQTLYAELLDIQNPDDAEYLSGRPYNIKMRYTLLDYQSGARSQSRSKTYPLKMTTRWFQVSGALGRPQSTGSVMATHYEKKGNYPAWKHAGYPDYSDDPKVSAEWCHLIADSLGGPTHPSNLVAASYAANTHMAAIEGCLNGNSKVQIRVMVYAAKDHIAEHITYQVKLGSKSACFEIDARCSNFSSSDAEKTRKRLHEELGL
ncbi:hypothetical protein G6O69_24950 [Pseudenhygromyxa sp. WMMC2535]|uniref:hypothetical protein n=1 Tax=Pseudenhygromyxa sp. WMMC2535 TaxID=2712867 RepID=UPI001595AA17|nr:hypothetical protein [Pseudenhygromyxa sp. WMMC2535]NVB41112.1 hypothetical protein [Pseudenhygromyxa sp. WMMC2535]